MKTILLFGAGKSATSLIEYLGKHCEGNSWKLVVGDANLVLAQKKTYGIPNSEAVAINVTDSESRISWIQKADIVISMLPPALHYLVAVDCISCSKNLLTASYIDENIRSLQPQIKEKGLLFLGEIGLDPGIDHMSAMQIIQNIQNRGGVISSFSSHCGGLVAPESDDNPWHYKITWNPANVVSAGRAGAEYLLNGKKMHVPYDQIFAGEGQTIQVPSLRPLAWYANRDSLSYIDLYKIPEVKTFLRTTLRYPAFCRGWDKFVKMNLTATDDIGEVKDFRTIADWFRHKFTGYESFLSAEFEEQIQYLGLTSEEGIPNTCTSSALILQYLLETRLPMKANDKDMIVIAHEVEYFLKGKKNKSESVLIVKGDDQEHTAMAKTVGLPLGIAANLILSGKLNLKGLHIPVLPQIYTPVLEELKQYGIEFVENDESIA